MVFGLVDILPNVLLRASSYEPSTKDGTHFVFCSYEKFQPG